MSCMNLGTVPSLLGSLPGSPFSGGLAACASLLFRLAVKKGLKLGCGKSLLCSKQATAVRQRLFGSLGKLQCLHKG